MNPYDFGTFHFMFQCDELTSQEFIEKKGYKKLNHNQLGELAEIYFFIRIRLRQLSDATKPKNDKEKKIAMTAPVISDCPSEGLSSYSVSFVMPKEYSIDDLPKANTSLVSIEQESLGDVAVLTFGGWATEFRSISYQQKLSALLKKSGIESQGGFMVAQFNSPWTLPMFRKNELMARIINKSSVN